MTETETIQAIRALFPPCLEQRNAPFTADAELLRLADGLYAFSMDEFSPAEDFFADRDPQALGHNLAVAVLSDVLAAGCRPKFYLQAITEPHGQEGFARDLSAGVRDVLNACGCFLVGGDLGRGETWRYTGVAIGVCPGATPLTRILPPRPQKLWITGTIGDGNLQAFSRQETVFELRLREAALIRQTATASIDTSGGLVEALSALQLVNPGHAFHLVPETLPFDQRVIQVADKAGLPLAGFAFGGAGEYELLFASDEKAQVDFASHIGWALPGATPGIYWGKARLPEALPDPRGYRDTSAYIQALLRMIQSCQI